MQLAGETPGDCGSWQTPMKLSGIERADAVDQVVDGARPLQAGLDVADVVLHAAGRRGEERDVGAALALELELAASMVSRIWSSLIFSGSLKGVPMAAIWRWRQALSSAGAVV